MILLSPILYFLIIYIFHYSAKVQNIELNFFYLNQLILHKINPILVVCLYLLKFYFSISNVKIIIEFLFFYLLIILLYYL